MSVSPGFVLKFPSSKEGRLLLVLSLLPGLYFNSTSAIVLAVAAWLCAALLSDLILALPMIVEDAEFMAWRRNSRSYLSLGKPPLTSSSMICSRVFWILFKSLPSSGSWNMSLIKTFLKKIQPYILHLKQDNGPTSVKELTPIESTQKLLETLKFSDGSYVYSAEMSTIQVPVYADNVLDQIRLTNHLIYSLKNDVHIPTSVLENRIKSVYLRDFFVDNSGNYVDVVERSNELAEGAYTLISLFIQKEETQQTDKNTFHNRLVLGPITQALIGQYQILRTF